MEKVHWFIRWVGIDISKIWGIAKIFDTPNQVVRLTFVDEASCADALKFEGVHNVKIGNKNFKVLVRDSNVEEKFVRITGIPHSMDLGVIQTRFKEFGKVLDMRWERYHVVENEYLIPTLSTWLICRMTLEKAIPSYVTVGDYRVIVRYNGQKQTCGICDETSHLRKDCPSLRKNKTDNNDKTDKTDNPRSNIFNSIAPWAARNPPSIQTDNTLSEETNNAPADIVESVTETTVDPTEEITSVVGETPAKSVMDEAVPNNLDAENEMDVGDDDSASTHSHESIHDNTQDTIIAIPAGQKAPQTPPTPQTTQTTTNDLPSISATISSVSSGSDASEDNIDIETDPSWSTVTNKRKDRSPQRPKASGESKDPLSLSPRQQQKLAKLISKDTFTRLAEVKKNKPN
jgi:hypothetical protein